MKTLQYCALVMPLLAVSLAYAGSKSFDFKYTSDQFVREPAFYCVTNAKPTLANSVTVTIVSDPELQMIGGNSITDTAIVINFLDKYYFQASHKPNDTAHVTITLSGDKVNENTELNCLSGKQGKISDGSDSGSRKLYDN